jgi:hypothetical protein
MFSFCWYYGHTKNINKVGWLDTKISNHVDGIRREIEITDSIAHAKELKEWMNINNKSKDMKINKTLFHIDEVLSMNYANISELELQLSDNKRTVLLLRESLITLYNEDDYEIESINTQLYYLTKILTRFY